MNKITNNIYTRVKNLQRISVPLQRSFKTTHQKYNQSTIDKENVKIFADKMKVWWDVGGSVKALHEFNKLRVPFIRDGLSKCKGKEGSVNIDNMKILDVGCGGGILSEALAKEGGIVTGLDASEELIYIAKQHSEQNNSIINKPTYLCTTIEDHAQEYKNYYDAVVASEVIEHVNHKELFVKSCVETLKPGGKIFFTAPNKTRLTQFVLIWFGENIMNSPPKGSHQYEMFISDKDLKELLRNNKCETDFTRGLFLNVVTTKWNWRDSTSFIFALQATKQAN